jgi:hypothetical protein
VAGDALARLVQRDDHHQQRGKEKQQEPDDGMTEPRSICRRRPTTPAWRR